MTTPAGSSQTPDSAASAGEYDTSGSDAGVSSMHRTKMYEQLRQPRAAHGTSGKDGFPSDYNILPRLLHPAAAVRGDGAA
jgi:hypothetical protein